MDAPPFDRAKDAANVAKHGVSLSRAEDMEIIAFHRSDRDGEVRFRAFGYIDGVAHCLVFTMRDGAMRPISLRRAHQKEIRRYEP